MIIAVASSLMQHSNAASAAPYTIRRSNAGRPQLLLRSSDECDALTADSAASYTIRRSNAGRPQLLLRSSDECDALPYQVHQKTTKLAIVVADCRLICQALATKQRRVGGGYSIPIRTTGKCTYP